MSGFLASLKLTPTVYCTVREHDLDTPEVVLVYPPEYIVAMTGLTLGTVARLYLAAKGAVAVKAQQTAPDRTPDAASDTIRDKTPIEVGQVWRFELPRLSGEWTVHQHHPTFDDRWTLAGPVPMESLHDVTEGEIRKGVLVR